VRIRSNRSSHGQSISAGLFLGDSPRLLIRILQCKVSVNQFWPLNPSFNFHNSMLVIQMEHLAQLSDIDQHCIGTQLLPSHRVPPTRN